MESKSRETFFLKTLKMCFATHGSTFLLFSASQEKCFPDFLFQNTFHLLRESEKVLKFKMQSFLILPLKPSFGVTVFMSSQCKNHDFPLVAVMLPWGCQKCYFMNLSTFAFPLKYVGEYILRNCFPFLSLVRFYFPTSSLHSQSFSEVPALLMFAC